MNDPRLVLSSELQLLGVSETLATTIALDAGSSQVVVDRNYLKCEVKISDDIDIEKALRVVQDFYSGALFN